MKSVFFLGPYGNLTTLYGGILSLHPEVIGLNHGRNDLPASTKFFDGQEIQRKHRNFQEFIRNQQSPFEDHHARWNGAFRELEEIASYKTEKARMCMWKESGYLTTQIRVANSMEKIIQEIPDVMFIRPIRNPIDCIQTHLRCAHYELYDDPVYGGMMKKIYLEKDQIDGALPRYLCEWYAADLKWYLSFLKKYPERFMIHFESDHYSNITDFLGLETTAEWMEIANTLAHKIRQRPERLALSFVLRKELLANGDPVSYRICEEFLSNV